MSSMSNPIRQDALLTYRQLVMDIKLEFAAHYHGMRTYGADRPPGGYAATYKRLDAAARELKPIYRAITSVLPAWLEASLIRHSEMVDFEEETKMELAWMINGYVGRWPDLVRQVDLWSEGQVAVRGFNPF